MIDKIISQKDFQVLLDELAAKRRIVGPVRKGDRFFYQEVQNPAELNLVFDYCTYSPKQFLLPAVETLFNFDRRAGAFVAQPVFDKRPLALVGVHPCDVHAIRLLDRVFTSDHEDQHYLHRRENTFIVAVDCPKPCTPGVFCSDLQTNEAREGFDVLLYVLDDNFAIVYGSDEGRDWILASDRASTPTKRDHRMLEQYQLDKDMAFPEKLRTKCENIPSVLERSYDSLLWEATAKRCYSCGSCNLVCPTCYCFNIADECGMDVHQGSRYREWDACMLRDFATVAGGHNFRTKPAQRLRHRIYRKAAWIRKQTGLAGCVGCARCDRACTAKISIVEILNQLAEENSHAS